MSDATGFYVVLHYRDGRTAVGGPFISHSIASGYASAKEAANNSCQAVITGPIPKNKPDKEADIGIVARLRKLAGL
jgi:hypothetical protein